MQFSPLIKYMRRIDDWMEDHPFIDSFLIGVAIGVGWLIGSVVFGDPDSPAIKQSFVVGLAAFFTRRLILYIYN